jgi:hypothetical protein
MTTTSTPRLNENESQQPNDGMAHVTAYSLFHVTTGRKVKLYRQTGHIKGPVRGFDTLMAAMAWAMKTGRKVIMRVEPVTRPQMLPDHHNAYGRAWWTESVPMSRVKCEYSAEGAWDQPDNTNNQTE